MFLTIWDFVSVETVFIGPYERAQYFLSEGRRCWYPLWNRPNIKKGEVWDFSTWGLFPGQTGSKQPQNISFLFFFLGNVSSIGVIRCRSVPTWNKPSTLERVCVPNHWPASWLTDSAPSVSGRRNIHFIQHLYRVKNIKPWLHFCEVLDSQRSRNKV